jgi:hypothetical protein
MLPEWALFGFATAVFSALVMLMQEKLKVNGFALAFCNKVTCVLLMVPFVAIHGLPFNPWFYFFVGSGACLWAISDVILFRTISEVGAGTVSRLLPSSVVFSFMLWFAIDPTLLDKYMHRPIITAAIFGVLCIWVYFATHLRKCSVSMEAARKIWFVIFGAVVGPILAKKATDNADITQGPYAYIFSEGLMMLTLWSAFICLRKPVSAKGLLSLQVWKKAFPIGCVSAAMVITSLLAYYHVDNPAYIPAVKFLDSVIILAAYRLSGRRNDAKVLPGIGVVTCAALLIILKAQI